MERFPYRYVEAGTLENGEKIAVTDGQVKVVLTPTDEYVRMHTTGGSAET